MRTQTLRLGEAPEAATEQAAVAAPTSSAPEAAVTAPPSASETEVRPEPESQPTVVATAPATERPAPVAAPAPQPPAPSKQQAAGAGDWTVQLGSFGEEANARRLAQRASTFGYKAEVSSYRSGGRTLYRVRVGPQATRGAADAAASALRAHGLDARVVAAR